MFTGFTQHKALTLPEALKIQHQIKKKTYVKPEIFKIHQEEGDNFFLVVEQPKSFSSEEDIVKLMT
jgi:hypothetical protein